MRKREFVGIGAIGGMICFGCFLFGKNKEFMKGYRDADNITMNESFEFV